MYKKCFAFDEEIEVKVRYGVDDIVIAEYDKESKMIALSDGESYGEYIKIPREAFETILKEIEEQEEHEAVINGKDQNEV